ncbi:hypothetical protein H2509_18340 [Stappia sp. F7233]|uniref:Uncharacterized protein n=1 Tax=Stappia albiluteola TaxID=2758565 RepID=A0A839AHB5_9HYPH|nr:hypothetical protein [Stappia albiluteola]MBA5779093.1 hypothetical protein [Stappia albiluteola]
MLTKTTIALAAVAITAIAVAGVSITGADAKNHRDVAVVAGAVASFAGGAMVLGAIAKPRPLNETVQAVRVYRPFCRVETTREWDSYANRWQVYTERAC